jgi:uncharacterized protein YlxW (UPF0749 family)
VKVKGNHVVLSLVFLGIGFLIAFSFQFTLKQKAPTQVGEKQWEKENKLRNEIINEQQGNRELLEELKVIQEKVQIIEQEQAQQEQISYNLVEDIEKLRMITGDVKIQGPGVIVSLSDASYIPDEDNPNNYIVHEQDIQKVIYELLITGAEAVAVNGQRISHNSYIFCIGPVVEVDGKQYFAPFEISAIGDAEKLTASLNLAGNIKDQLVQDGIEVKITKKSEIIMNPYLSKEG